MAKKGRGKEMKDVRSVVQWFKQTPEAEKEDGYFINLASGAGTPIYADGLDPSIVSQLAEDNVFIHDVIHNTGPKGGWKADNIRFEKTEAGLTKATLAKFPRKEKSKEPAKSEPEAKPSEELWRLEIFGEPVGGDQSGEWNIAVELDKNNYPVSDAVISFRAGKAKIQKPTDKKGCWDENITVEENVFGRVVFDSSISISNIPVAGPETNEVAKRVYSWREVIENIIFLVWTIILFASFVYGFRSAYIDLTTPYADKKASMAQKPSSGTAPAAPQFSWEKPKENEAVKIQNSSSISVGWILVWLLGWLIWLIMIPVFFINDIWEALTRAAGKSMGLVSGWVHERKPFHYTVEVTRNKGKIVDQPVYMREGRVISAPEDKEGLKSKLKEMSLPDMMKSFKLWDLASDLGVILLDRFVLGKIFGGR